VERGELIAYADTSGKARIRLPQWQFSSPKTLHPWVGELVSAFGGNGWPLLDFLTTERRTGKGAGRPARGKTYLALLLAGDTDLVLEAARRANPA
jgi:hypothetical protein